MEINMKNILSISDKEIKKVKIKLTKENVNNLFEYRDGDLYWKIDSASRRTKKGDIAGCIHNKTGKNKCYKVKVSRDCRGRSIENNINWSRFSRKNIERIERARLHRARQPTIQAHLRHSNGDQPTVRDT